MYAAPPRIMSEVFATLPEKFFKGHRNTEWHKGQPGSGFANSLLEGPSFDRQGNLYCVDIPFGRIFRISPKGEFTLVTEYDGEPNGLKIHKDGRIFIADYKNGIMQLDPDTGTVTPFVTRYRVEHFKAVNDLIFASNGDLYFTDQGLTGLHDPSGRVFRVRASDGQVDCLMSNIPSPNGLVLDLTETVLYVAVTRANAIWRLPLMPDGGVAKAGNFIQMSGGGGPDGMALDQEGNIVVGHLGTGAWLFSKHGLPMAWLISCRGNHLTNMAYGGPDNRTLYMTESETGTILTARLDVPGRLMYSHM